MPGRDKVSDVSAQRNIRRAASFYGDGFVHLKTEESSSRTSLHVRFRTNRPTGLLFLAAGETDFLWVELHSGLIQVRMDLGSGEGILQSEIGIQLNDLAWHSIELQHERHNVTLTVDKYSYTSLTMPGSDVELSVQEGLFVGGIWGLDKPYISREQINFGFRGCLDEVLFNQHNLLSSLRPYSGYKSVNEVSLGCSPQFSATVEDPISFFSSKAYMSLPLWESSQDGMFEFKMHTLTEEGILLYSSAGQGDYVAMELREGRLVAVVGKDGTKTTLHSLVTVNDGRWHSVKLHLFPRSLLLTVGQEILNSSFGTRSRALKLNGPLFLGGVDVITRTEAQKNGLLSAVGKRIGGGSFKGCLRNIRLNDQRKGLPNALVTKDISVGCEPERDSEPTTIMTPTAPPSYTPDSDDQLSGQDRKRFQNFLLLRDLVVPEGGRAPLGSTHITLNLDFRKLGIRQSQIMFRIEEQPVHGQLRLDVDADQENTFGVLDLWHGRVMYVHGGSEDPLDFFMFSIFTSSKKEVPAYLKGNRLHRFNISITPINDAPEISLPEGSLFVVPENSKRRLNTDMLRVTDPDSNSSDLVFSVLANLNADSGFLETEDRPGQPVISFSYHDLEQGKVSYVHTGIRNSRMAIRVSDGDKVSNTVVFRIMAVPLDYNVVNNTGVDVIQGGAAVIGNKHLAVQVNVVKQAVDIRYDVTHPPTYGELQRLHSSGEWKQTSTFTQKLLEKERLRYLSTYQGTDLSNVTDSFKCRITIGSVATDELLFPVRVRWILYKVTRNKMEVFGDHKVTLTPQELRVVMKGVRLSESDVYFRILKLPKKGNLLLNNKILKENSTFSQKNVTDLKVQYELVNTPQDSTRDTFSFQVFSKYACSGSHDFRISIKTDLHNIILTSHGLSLMEGESKVITKAMLFAETQSSTAALYTIISSPKHGKIMRINLSNSTTNNDNIMTFTNQDITEERILYVHDDSETTQDSFRFLASVSSVKDKMLSLEGSFNISIQLVNDEKPVRVVDKVFHVVRNGQRLLTLEDLCYHDADSDFDDAQLLYTRRGIPMGELVLVNDTSQKLYQFRQRDMAEKRVLFTHKGVSFGRFVLFVSDGKHYTSTLLEVSAQDPYIRVDNNTGLHVQKGFEAVIASTNLSVITNMDVRNDEEVVFELFISPMYGGLYHKGVMIDSFTQHDLKTGQVVYRHDDSKNLADSFNLTVKVKEVHLDISVAVSVYLEDHQRPPRIIRNNLILVEEGKPVKIHKKDLKVMHQNNTPSEIVYSVKVGPTHGYLRHSMDEEEHYQGTPEKPVQSFSQAEINAGHIQYVQVAPGCTNDSFIVDITNRITEIKDVMVAVDIIPLRIPIEVSNLTLKEGSSMALNKDIIKVTSHHFSGFDFLYHLTEAPLHGHIEHSRIPGVPIPSFTRMQAEQDFIYYVHDGSETTADNFTLIANDTDLGKHSLPYVLFINITPVNDEAPVITVNRILRVWVGSVTEITTEELNAEDPDTLPESIEFIVTPPSNGHLALKSAPSRPVLNFTQAHILQGQLVFVHTGAMSGGFHFQVNDGVNFAARQTFSIIAQALVLSLEKNRELRVYPGSSQVLSDEELLVVSNDYNDITGNRTIIYTITSPPKLGRLVWRKDDNSSEEIFTFTQNMVDEGVVIYEQSHTDSIGWTAIDSFTFTVSSPPTSLPAHTFNIHISYENTGPEHRTALLLNTGAVVTEGGRVKIGKSHLDATNLLRKVADSQKNSYEIWYGVTSLPHHGIILVGEQNLTQEKPNFSQSFLDKYGITYVHDDSETKSDHFTIDVWLNPRGKPAQWPMDSSEVVTESFSITVTPVNDQPPKLKTRTPSLRVVQGDIVTLSPKNLHVEDQDTPPEEILYTVISKPNNGFLALEGRLNESTQNFTQADVDNGKLYFVQEGQVSTGVFYLSVTDGAHRPLYKLLNVEVMEPTITIANNTGLTLLQGQTTTTLILEHLAAVTNERNTTIRYQVTVPPSHGMLMIEGQQVTQFDQEDLRLGKVSYHMTELTSPNDSFKFTAFTSKSNLTTQVVNITVRPLIHLRRYVRIPEGIAVKLRKDVLNATKLASVTESDPIFEIIVPPKHGRLVNVTFGLRGTSQSVKTFSFRDIEEGRVAIVENINVTAIHGNTITTRQNITVPHVLNDSFVFLLKAENVQPAIGEFVFIVMPYDPVTGKHIIIEGPMQTTRSPAFNRTTNAISPLHTQSHTNTMKPPKTHTKFRTRNRWGNHTRGRSMIPTVPRTTSTGKEDMHPGKNTPVRMESLPRPASDPLLIILPLLACLALIIILVVLILVFRHRREKRAQPTMIHNLSESHGEDLVSRGAYLGQPERSLTVPSVIVTPLTPSCPGSPVLEVAHGPTLMRAITPPDSPLLLCPWKPVDPETVRQCQSATPPLRQNQYWV
ncbi:chondroitin sulfate proteoglycan 4-like [Chanos chanos]|uniref:Chondroitin sulfate proteoglycan 4-like n=1 Tax=Chanos chanos TaxID=29144 RepID=A0A6J2UXG2_CHACN|nr:chondroitin sulfate proteoglycan 4-like [Chanos chanos]